jgi:hypothetical protein
MASIAFRRHAWRGFEHALDPLGALRPFFAAVTPSRERDLRVSKTPFRTENESFPKRVRGCETEGP